jgi:hypothetical protein
LNQIQFKNINFIIKILTKNRRLQCYFQIPTQTMTSLLERLRVSIETDALKASLLKLKICNTDPVGDVVIKGDNDSIITIKVTLGFGGSFGL